MNLILQGPQGDAAAIPKIAALVQARRTTSLIPQVWRCEDIAFSEGLKREFDPLCFEAKLDYAFTEPGRRLSDFRLLVMDMDSTLITIECIDEIADMQGLKPQVSEITESAMRGEIDFRQSLTKRVALLKGLEASALQRVYDERLRLSPGAETMLSAVQKAGLKTLLVSGGFTFFTDRMKTRLGLDYTHSNVLEIEDGKLTGKVIGTIVDAEEKQRMVERICTELGISPRQAIVMGDGANDLKMMSIAGLSVAFRAKPVVRAKANLALNFAGLDGILHLFEQA
jgi:phosphoserine phosphatase